MQSGEEIPEMLDAIARSTANDVRSLQFGARPVIMTSLWPEGVKTTEQVCGKPALSVSPGVPTRSTKSRKFSQMQKFFAKTSKGSKKMLQLTGDQFSTIKKKSVPATKAPRRKLNLMSTLSS